MDASVDAYDVSTEERALMSQDMQIEAIRKYQEHIGNDLLTAIYSMSECECTGRSRLQ